MMRKMIRGSVAATIGLLLGTGLLVMPAAHAATAMTVTATETVSGGELNGLNVAVLDGAAATQNGAVVTASGSQLSPGQASITPTGAGSYVYGALTSWSNHGSALTANSATTFKASLTNGNTDSAVFRSVNRTTAGTPVTLGASAPTGQTAGSLALAEIRAASGQTLTEDASTPAGKTGTTTALTTASFTPPAGSLLVAASTGSGPAGPYAITVSNSTGLTWHQLVLKNPSGNDIAGVWYAVVPGGSTAVAGNTKMYLEDLDQTSLNWATVAPQYSAIELNIWNTAAKSAINSASASTKVYAYKDLSSTRNDDCGTSPGGGSPCVVNGVICPTGVNDATGYGGGLPFCATWRAHPDWFLTNDGTTATSSTPFSNLHVYSGFANANEMDYGNAAYQNAWATQVISDLQAGGWNGTRADNALDKASAYGGVPKYSTDAAVQTATQAMLANVGPKLIAAGLDIIPNLGYDNVFPTLWGSWLQYVSGMMQEYAFWWQGGGDQGAGWGTWMAPEVSSCAASGKLCYFHFGGHAALTTAQSNYAVASFLLFTDGSSYIENGGDNNPTADAAIAQTLGAATGAAVQNGSSWTRQFACGSVSVNTSTETGTVTKTC